MFCYLFPVIFLLFAFFLKNRQRIANYLILISLFFIGISRLYSFNTLEADDISNLAKMRIKRVYLEGTVTSQPEEKFSGTSFIFRVTSVKPRDIFYPASGLVLVQSYKKIKLQYADKAQIKGRLSLIKNDGFFNRKLIRERICTKLTLGKYDKIISQKQNPFNLIRMCLALRDRLREKFDNLAAPAAGFLKAVLLADKADLDDETVAIFRYTGTAHILAISGLHIGIIVFMVLVFLKVLRIKQRPRFVISLIFFIIYSIMIGARPSIIRAVVMAVIFLLSFIVGRQYQICNSLALAALIILFCAPYQIFDVGFQLSFISVLSIVALSPKILACLPKPKSKIVSYLTLSFIVSFSAWLGTLPLVAYYFGIVTPVGLFANVVVIFLTSVIMGAGFVFLLFSYLCGPLAQLIALTIEFMVELLLYTTAWFSKWPFAFFYTDKVNLPIVSLYYTVLLIIFNFGRLRFKLKRKDL